MAGKWEELPRLSTLQIQLVETTCDRCGMPSTIRGFGARDSRAWGEVKVHTQGTFDLLYADLCRDCSEGLIAWINNHGGGNGAQTTTDRVNEQSRAERVNAD